MENNRQQETSEQVKRRYKIRLKMLSIPGSLIRPVTDDTGTRDYLLMPIDSVGFAWKDNELFYEMYAVERRDYDDNFCLLPAYKADDYAQRRVNTQNPTILGSMAPYSKGIKRGFTPWWARGKYAKLDASQTPKPKESDPPAPFSNTLNPKDDGK